MLSGPTAPHRERVGEAARRLVELRDGWLNPPGLEPAVLAAHGWPRNLADAEILERLLALNLEREPVASGTRLQGPHSSSETK